MLSMCYAESPISEKNKELITLTRKFWDAMDSIKIDQVLQLTHPSIYGDSSGKEKFSEHLKLLKAENTKLKTSVIGSSLGKVSETMKIGDQEIVFIPRNYSIDRGEQVQKIQTFAIAIRSNKNEKWRFIDGGFFGPDSKAILEFFPKLPKNTKFPIMKSTYVDKRRGE